jgi:competence protein ComEC
VAIVRAENPGICGTAPSRFASTSFLTAFTVVGITEVRWAGPDDAHNPNNEFIEVAIDPQLQAGTFDLTGWSLRNDLGDRYTFPTGFTLTRQTPRVRVYSGSGSNSATSLYWSKAGGVWPNVGGCVYLESNGYLKGKLANYNYKLSLGTGASAVCH